MLVLPENIWQDGYLNDNVKHDKQCTMRASIGVTSTLWVNKSTYGQIWTLKQSSIWLAVFLIPESPQQDAMDLWTTEVQA